jgi:hypothetical protein
MNALAAKAPYSVKALNGSFVQHFVNEYYYLELYYYSDCDGGNNVSFRFDPINSYNLVPICFQYAKAKDMAEARDWAEKLLAAWSAQMAEFGSTDVGGYPLMLITDEGDTYSFEGVRENFGIIARDYITGCGPRVVGCVVNYEDEDAVCELTGKAIASAYSE